MEWSLSLTMKQDGALAKRLVKAADSNIWTNQEELKGERGRRRKLVQLTADEAVPVFMPTSSDIHFILCVPSRSTWYHFKLGKDAQFFNAPALSCCLTPRQTS